MGKVKATGLEGSVSGEGTVLGVNTSGEASGAVGVAYAGAGVDGPKLKTENGKLNEVTLVDAHAEAGVSAAEGEVSGSYGVASGEASGKVLTAEAKASGKAVLMENGKLAPQIQAEVKAEANVAQGEVGATVGNEYIDAHVKAEGEVLHAEAHAGVGAGKITYEDEDGNTQTDIGVYAEVGAEAYVAKGSISGGITICGVEINVTAEGKVGGAGAKAGAEVSTGKLKAGLGLGFLAGLGLEIEIDWSNFKWPGKDDKVDKIKSKKLASKGSPAGGSGKTNVMIHPKKLKKEEDTFRDASKKLSQYTTQVNSIKSDLSISGAGAGEMKKLLGTVADNMEEQKNNLKKVADTLQEISELYTNAENTIKSNV